MDRLNLKRVLMELDDALVARHGFEPALCHRAVVARFTWSNRQSTLPLLMLTDYLNRVPEAREVLAEMGIDWPVVEGDVGVR